MSTLGGILHLYRWKEELANKLGKSVTNAEMTMFKEFNWWFDSISFDRIEPDTRDLEEWHRKFEEIEKKIYKKRLTSMYECVTL